MMSKSKSFNTLKAQLIRKEKLYKGKISDESDELELHTTKLLKSSAIVGGGLVIGYGLFKLLSGKEKRKQVAPEKKKVKTAEVQGRKSTILQAAIMDKIIAFIIQLVFRYLSKKIHSSDEGDSESTAV
jgi:predicted histidine transporter YuiF (NhaC family)